MRASLIYNPDAGDGDHSPKMLKRLLSAAGYTVRAQSSDSDEFPSLLAAPADLVVVAGGDGTVTKTLAHMADRQTPVGVLAFGTANNMARAFCADLPFREAIQAFPHAPARPLDLGVSVGPWGRSFTIEGGGVGALAKAMRDFSCDKGDAEDELAAARKAIAKRLAKARPRTLEVRLDGETIEGPFLFMEWLNIPYMGPALALGCRADPGDGMLDLVWAREDAREALLDWLDRPEDPAPVQMRRGRRVEMVWTEGPMRRGDKFPSRPPYPVKVRYELDGTQALILSPGAGDAR